MRITVIGCGYLGATHAAAMAELGHEVLGIEIDPVKRQELSEGRVPIYEPGLSDLLSHHVTSGRLRFTDSYAEIGAFGDLHFLCVGTPQMAESLAADLSQVEGAVEMLAAHLTRPAVVVGKSTVPVGTAERMARRLAEVSPAGADVLLAWNPEFLREGFAVEDSMHPDRIVLGISDSRAEKVLREFYGPLIDAGTPVVVTDYATAELVKVAANAFLATKDLLHQRDGRGVRGHGCRRRGPGRLARVRRPHRPPVPAGRDRLRRRVPAEGHPGVRPPGR